MADTPSSVVPYPLAMVVCDNVHTDPGNGKLTLLGTFSIITAAQFPAIHPFMCLYVALTDSIGAVPVKIELVAADDDECVLSIETEAKFADRRAVLETVWGLPLVRFPRAGEYRFQLTAGGQFLMERRIVVVGTGEKATGDNDDSHSD